MAETLVLANLSIDPSGVVSGLAVVNSALGKGETAVKKFGTSQEAVTRATAPLSTVLRGLGLNFGGVGNIISRLGPMAGSLGVAFVGLRAAMRTEEVKEFSAEWSKLSGYWASSALQVTGMTRFLNWMTGGMKEANAALAGTESFPEVLKRMNLSDPIGQMADLVQVLGRVRAEASKEALPFYLKQIADQAEKLSKEGVKVPGVLAALIPPKVVKDVREFGEQTVATFDEFLESINKAAASTNFDVVSQGALDLATAIGVVSQKIRTLEAPGALTEQTAGQVAFFEKQKLDLIALAELYNAAGISVAGFYGELVKFPEMSEFDKTLTTAQVQFQIFETAVAGISTALVNSIGKGGKEMKKALGQALKDLSIFYGVQALAQFAMGVAASTPWGQLLGMGEPAKYFLAAKGFAAAAVACGIGAAALGGWSGSGAGAKSGGGHGGGGGRGGGEGRRAAGGGGGGGGSPTVTVHVHGSMIGTDPNELARDLSRLIDTAQADGSR